MSMDQNGYSAGRAAYPRGVDSNGRPVYLDSRGFAIVGRRRRPTKAVGGETNIPMMTPGMRGRMGNNNDGARTIRGFGGEQAAVKEAEETEKRAGDWEERFGGDDNAAVIARKEAAAEDERTAKGEPSDQMREGAARFREQRMQEEMGGAANQEALQTGRAPLQDGAIATTTGRMAFRNGEVVGESEFVKKARRRRN